MSARAVYYIGARTTQSARAPSSARGLGALDMNFEICWCHFERHRVEGQFVRGELHIHILHAGHLECHARNRSAARGFVSFFCDLYAVVRVRFVRLASDIRAGNRARCVGTRNQECHDPEKHRAKVRHRSTPAADSAAAHGQPCDVASRIRAL
eukprot:scaffold126600_cov60-Phaeocystis_antarctica.AAC.4